MLKEVDVKAIIFDMDGVIVDTEYLDFKLQSAYIKSIAKNPEKLSHEDFSSLVGRTGGICMTESSHSVRVNRVFRK